MIDIWMLFTMTVPFLEVALHTCTEVMKRPGLAELLRLGDLLHPALLTTSVQVCRDTSRKGTVIVNSIQMSIILT